MSHIQARRVGERTNSVLSLPKPVLVCALSHICTSTRKLGGTDQCDSVQTWQASQLKLQSEVLIGRALPKAPQLETMTTTLCW